MMERQDHAYAILKTLHRCKRHVVYLAKHYVSQEMLVIKAIDQRWKNDPLLQQQLRDEAAIGLRLNHPHIRRTRAVFEEDATPYLVMDYIEGWVMEEVLGSAGISLALQQVKDWLNAILDALDHAHFRGIVHGNLSPSNMIIDKNGEPYLIGFGKPAQNWLNAEEGQKGIHPLMFVAPEVFLGENPSPASDVYSIGVMAYLMLCGRLPWTLDSRLPAKTQKQHSLQRPVIDPEFIGRTVPRWLYTVIHTCLRIEPGRRFASASQLRDALNAGLELPLEAILLQPLQPKPPEPPKLEGHESQKPYSGIRQGDNKPVYPPPSGPKPIVPPPKKPVPIRVEEDDKHQPIDPKTKRWGMIMGIASLLILIFIVVKYGFLERQTIGIRDQNIEDPDDEPILPREANQPIRMVYVQGDSTVIGSLAPEADDDEFPLVKLRVPSFWISPFEITNREWAMIYPQYYYNPKDKDLPVTNVSFLEVLEYCNEKSLIENLRPCYEFMGEYVCDFSANGYRLPTEAEWEYAAKAGKQGGNFAYSGSNEADGVGWYLENSDDRLKEVGKKQPNVLGLYDMSGNAYEWVWNWYAPYSSSGNPFEGPARGTDRVIRGGSYHHNAQAMRVSNRSYTKQFAKSPYLGFRLVRRQDK